MTVALGLSLLAQLNSGEAPRHPQPLEVRLGDDGACRVAPTTITAGIRRVELSPPDASWRVEIRSPAGVPVFRRAQAAQDPGPGPQTAARFTVGRFVVRCHGPGGMDEVVLTVAGD